MEDRVICPHCNHELGEKIPLALVGSIQLKCPLCGMFYLFQREEDTESLEQEEASYLSGGPFRRRVAVSNDDGLRPVNQLGDRFTCLFLCLIPDK